MNKAIARTKNKILNFFGLTSQQHAAAAEVVAFVDAKKIFDDRLYAYLKNHAKDIAHLHEQIDFRDEALKAYKEALQFIGRDGRCCCINVAREVARKALEKHAKA